MTRAKAARPAPFLLDVNVLIALVDGAHVQHDAAHEWFRKGTERLSIDFSAATARSASVNLPSIRSFSATMSSTAQRSPVMPAWRCPDPESSHVDRHACQRDTVPSDVSKSMFDVVSETGQS